MADDFKLFGPAHLAILLAIAAAAAGLSRWARTGREPARRIRLGLAVFLLVNELVWWGYRLNKGGLGFPDGLPLQLSDLVIWLTIIALLNYSRTPFEVAYYAGLTTATMAVITPDLWAPLASYESAYFFLGHGGVAIAVTVLVCGGMMRPSRGSVWRSLVAINLWAAAVGIFNVVFGTNYMYLCQKPAGASILDYLGPWPLYILAAEAMAVAIFWLLWLPFRGKDRECAVC